MFERYEEEKQHLSEAESDHYEIDAPRPERERADDQRRQCRKNGGQRQGDQPGQRTRQSKDRGLVIGVKRQNPDRIGTHTQEGRMAEGHQACVTDQEV